MAETLTTGTILWTADWHLRSRPNVWAALPDMVGDQEFMLQQLQQLTEEEDIRAVVLLGDITDSPQNRAPVLCHLHNLLTFWEQRRVRVYFIQGQHEYSNPPLLSAIHDWPVWLHKKRQVICGQPVYGLDYGPAAEVTQVLKDLPECAYLATHQVWKETMGPDRGQVSLADIPHSLHVMSGDLHKFVAGTEHGGPTNKVWFWSTGPILPQRANELWDPYVFLSRGTGVFPRQLRTRRGWSVTITTEEDMRAFERSADSPMFSRQEGVPDEVSKGVLVVRYSPSVTSAWERICRTVSDRMYIYPMLLPVEKTAEAPPAPKQGGIVQVLTSRFDVQSPAVGLVQRLITADGDAAEQLQREAVLLEEQLNSTQTWEPINDGNYTSDER